MRDGVELATDVYRPDPPDGPLPSILIRTQYGRDEEKFVSDFAGQGYVVLVQDLRGLGGSEGTFTLGGHDAEDGYDTLDWIVSQPWSNGRVGTFGCSSLGINQILLAQLRHPAHACAIAAASGGASGSAGQRYSYWDVRRGGAVEIGWSVFWFAVDCAKDGRRPDPPSKEAYDAALHSLPVAAMIDRLTDSPTDWRDYVTREPADPWWAQFGFLGEQSVTDLPTLFVTSWYDVGAGEVLDQARQFRAHGASARARDHQYVIVAPTKHCQIERATADTRVGALSAGDARFDQWRVYLAWFDRWLCDEPEALAGVAPVRYFQLGRNVWREAEIWPPPGVRMTPFYLSSGGRGNSRLGDGRLAPSPTKGADYDEYVYDPVDPVPSCGGGAGGPYTPMGIQDQATVELRADVLCYSSESLAADLEISGPVRAVLHVSSSALDTDFTAKLVWVTPSGEAWNLCEGILRARYRAGFDQPAMMTPGEVYEIEIDLQATSVVMTSGSRVRLEVSSSNFPRFDRNLNTGGPNALAAEWIAATNRVHHSITHPSRLILPVVTS
jgi:putative CocE/NonD family hydrolase